MQIICSHHISFRINSASYLHGIKSKVSIKQISAAAGGALFAVSRTQTEEYFRPPFLSVLQRQREKSTAEDVLKGRPPETRGSTRFMADTRRRGPTLAHTAIFSASSLPLITSATPTPAHHTPLLCCPSHSLAVSLIHLYHCQPFVTPTALNVLARLCVRIFSTCLVRFPPSDPLSRASIGHRAPVFFI